MPADKPPAVPAIPETKRAIPKPVPRPLTAATPEPLLAIAETDSFVHFSQLKVPNGKDKFTTMNRRRLLAELGDQGNGIEQETERLWQQFNDNEGEQIPFGKLLFDGVLRWHLRGLSLKAAIRKVLVDRNIRRRSHAGRKAAAEAEQIAIAFAIFTESGV